MYTPIQTARLNDVDPQAWLADVLARISDHKVTGLASAVAMALGGGGGSAVIWRHGGPLDAEPVIGGLAP